MPGRGSIAVPKIKDVPLEVSRSLRTRANDAKLMAAYAEVDRRDQGIDRVTGLLTQPNAFDPAVRRDHHHLAGRNVRPDWVYDAKRIITVSRRTHKLLQKHAIEVEGDDANGRLIFRWNRDLIPVGSEPFRIRSKRRSQNAR